MAAKRVGATGLSAATAAASSLSTSLSGTGNMGLSAAIAADIRSKADSSVAAGASAYFKHVCPFLGVKTAGIEASVKLHAASFKKRLDHASTSSLLTAAGELMAEPEHELKHAAIFLLHFCNREVLLGQGPLTLLTASKGYFAAGLVNDWATCDTLSTRVMAPCILKDPSLAKQVAEEWCTAPDIWRRRSSAVTFVKLCAPELGFHSLLFASLEAALSAEGAVGKERFVQLGCGWLLRELSLHAKPSMLHFLEMHYQCMSREGLRYACEKLTGEERAAVLVGPPFCHKLGVAGRAAAVGQRREEAASVPVGSTAGAAVGKEECRGAKEGAAMASKLKQRSKQKSLEDKEGESKSIGLEGGIEKEEEEKEVIWLKEEKLSGSKRGRSSSSSSSLKGKK